MDSPPRPFDPARALRTFESLEGVVATPVLEAAFGNSPFLARLALREPQVLTADPHTVVAEAKALALSAADTDDEAEAMARLRIAKRRAALAIALADIAGDWPVETVTRALTEFADAAVKGGLRFLLHRAGGPDASEDNTGLVVLAMGKYGAFELNYSSDIDLVVFYDPERFPFRKRDDARGAAVDMVRGLARLLSEQTADGYVFRVDLRLRPDAGATQVAISTDAAEAYYEAMGQNWERAAMIKARACAGDALVGARFLKAAIEPFVWRRNLDFAAIEDIHSIKRQIHAHEGHGRVAVAGHNVKLGRGGIREIEFFAQTQQLILGGRNPNLRAPSTMAALDALAGRGLIGEMAARELKDAYRYLRKLEHRLQMIEDQQTHTLPKAREELDHVACFMGYGDFESFGVELTHWLETVQDHYVRLFEREAPLAGSGGNLVFTGVEDDPETLATLSAMGFRDAPHVAGAIRGWHHGRIRATRSTRARELLTKLVPALLTALAASADPDAAFKQFDRFVSGLPAGVQLFSLFLNRPELLKLIAEVAGSMPKLATHLARTPATLNALLDADYLKALPTHAELEKLLHQQLAAGLDYEAKLDAARVFAREQIFRVAAQIIERHVPPAAAGTAFSAIAQCVIQQLLPIVEDELAKSAGRMTDGRFVVIAMGKLGGAEMTASSDLDLIFVYDAPEGQETDGTQSLSAMVYYARLAQRLIVALTAFTGAGGLYEVDMRLRPTGNKGPAAVSLESFRRYHESDAWTWERLALTRARVVAGSDTLAREVDAVIHATLTRKWDEAALFKDAREMREKLAAQFPGKSRWDLKFAPGGLVDIEFIAQALQLKTGRLDTNTEAALAKLAMDDADRALLIEAASFQNALLHVLRIAVDGTFDPAEATAGLKALLVRAGGVEDFAALEARLADLQSRVRATFERVFGAA